MNRSMIITLLISINAGSIFAQKTASTDFKTTENGLQYRLYRDVKGTTAKITDHIEMHILSKVGDSLLFDSRAMNNNLPVPFQVAASTFKGDLVEGFTLLSSGDSAVFKVPIDSMLNSGAQFLPWMKKGEGMMMEYYVSMVSVKTAEQVDKETKAHAAKQKKIDESLMQAYFKKHKIQPLKTASGIYYTITKKGEGSNAGVGDSVSMNYTGKLLNGTIFDSNTDPRFQHVTPFWFELGMHQVITGWDEGIALLNKGAKAILYIPSALAYGPRSSGKDIPANSVLVFDVELADIQRKIK